LNSHELPDAKLQEVAQRLGARAAQRLDVERTAQAVVARLRTEPRARVRGLGGMRPWVWIAAALVIVVGAGAIVRSIRLDHPTTPALTTAAGAELNDLSADQLQQLLQEVGGGQPGVEQETISSQDVGLEDLSARELQALLQSMEG
jgi:hypothetical protein